MKKSVGGGKRFLDGFSCKKPSKNKGGDEF